MPTNIAVIEQQDSRTWSYDAGRVNASRTFRVYDTDGTLGVLTTVRDVREMFGVAVGANSPVDSWKNLGPDALPVKGELFPDESTVYARSYSVTHEPNTFLWYVTWNYSNAQVTASSAQPGEPGYVEWTLDLQATFQDTWIDSPTIPTDGTVTASSQVTGGTQIDIEGVPFSRLRYTSEIVINETIQTVSGLPSILTAMRNARGKRNNATWEGIAKGRALYTGGQIRRQGVSLYTATHRIVEDSEFHLVQVPDRDTSGRIPTSSIGGAQRATKVYWRQPFPSFYDFSSISTNW